MAFIYMSGGWSIRVPASREAVMNDLRAVKPGGLLAYEVNFPSGAAQSRDEVAVLAGQIALVSDQALPIGPGQSWRGVA